MKKFTIVVDWYDINSINDAERIKASLENADYRLVNTIVTFSHSWLEYECDDEEVNTGCQ